MQDEIKTAQNRIDRLSQELEALMAEAEKAEAMARNKLNEAHEALRNLLWEADSHLPQADRFCNGPDGKEFFSCRVVIESIHAGIMTARIAGVPDGVRMTLQKRQGVWVERGTKMVLRNVPDNIAEILGAAK
jgi:hypothetical protein